MNAYLQRVLAYSLGVSIVGALFKLMHWQGANVILIVGLSSLAITSIIQGLLEKSVKSNLKGIVIAAICIAVLFKLMHWPNGELFFKIALTAGITWFVYTNFIAKEDNTQS